MRRGLIGSGVGLLLMALPGGASALTLGAADPANTDPGSGGLCVAAQGNFIQGSVAPGFPSYTVPQGGGTLTSWRTRWGTNGATATLQVWRPDPLTSGGYRLVAKDTEPLTEDANGFSTYTVSIPVQAGDTIGLGWPTANTVHCSYNSPADANTIWGVNGTSFNIGDEGDFSNFIVLRDLLNVQAALSQTADLAISQTVNRAWVVKGNAVSFLLRAVNIGPAPVTATITDRLPAGLSFFSAAADNGSCRAGPTVSCNVSLGVGASSTISIAATASALGRKTNTATIASSAADAAPANNRATVSVNVVSVPKLGRVKASVHGHTVTLKFKLDQAAKVKVRIGRHTRTLTGKAGQNKVRVKNLGSGRHTATVVASTAAGSSAPRTVSFRVP